MLVTCLRRACAALASLICLVAAPQAFGQATRTWVSGVGDDANPCSRTAPCKTFAGAISKTAAGGEISVLDPGGFGAVTITKSITINGDGTIGSVLASGTNGVVVSAGSSDVIILRNISINGAATGVNGVIFNTGAELHVENVTIHGFTGAGILFRPSADSSLFVAHTSLRDNANGGIHILPIGSGNAIASIDNATIEGNGFGVRAEDGSRVFARNCTIVGNGTNGFAAAATFRPSDMLIESSLAAANGAAGVLAGPLSTVKLSNVVSTKNNLGIQSVGGALVSFGNNRIFGNVTAEGAPTSVVPSM